MMALGIYMCFYNQDKYYAWLFSTDSETRCFGYQVMFVNMSRLTIHVQAEKQLCVQVRYLLGSN